MVRPRTCRSPRRNLPPGGEDELVEDSSKASIEGNNTPTLFLPVSQAQTLTSAQAPALPSNKKLFQQFMKAYLENQNQNQAPPLASI